MPKIPHVIVGLALLLAGLLSGCSNLLYKPDIQQGNLLTQEMIDKLKPGMSPRQVRFVLGTPLIIDTFHKDRWDYVYFFKKGDASKPQRRKLTVIFKDERLVEIRNTSATEALDGVLAAEPSEHQGGRRQHL